MDTLNNAMIAASIQASAKPLRGLALMKARDPQRFLEICSKGGIKSHQRNPDGSKPRTHEFSKEEAKRASDKAAALRRARAAAQTAENTI
jgi:general stress protein YciG